MHEILCTSGSKLLKELNMAAKTTETAETATTPTADTAPKFDAVALFTQAGDAYLKAIAAAQESFIKTAKTAMEKMPKLPSVPAPEFVPTPKPVLRDTLEAGFDFSAKYVDNQKAYADQLLSLVGA